MEPNELMNNRLSRRVLITAMARLGMGGATLAGLSASGLSLTGCGSSHTDNTPVSTSRTGRFVTANQFASKKDIGIIIGRTYIELQNGVPVVLGWEFPNNMIPNLPPAAFDTPDLYYLPLPPEADATPFKYMVFSNWTNGHSPRGIGDPPHLHPVFGISPPGTPEPDNHDELAPVTNPDEIPAGYVPGGTLPGGATIASGIGQAFEYPTAPQMQPGWNTTAQNYFFYKGHMNAIGMGATYAFLDSHQTNTLPIVQPKIHPVAGWYPTKNVTRYDGGSKSFIFELTDWIHSTQSL